MSAQRGGGVNAFEVFGGEEVLPAAVVRVAVFQADAHSACAHENIVCIA